MAMLMFECPECLDLHDEPSDARLGHLVLCLHCAVVIEIAMRRADLEFLSAA